MTKSFKVLLLAGLFVAVALVTGSVYSTYAAQDNQPGNGSCGNANCQMLKNGGNCTGCGGAGGCGLAQNGAPAGQPKCGCAKAGK